MVSQAHAEREQTTDTTLHVELRKRAFAGLASADFSISQSNTMIAALAHELYGRIYLDEERETHSLYTGPAERSEDERTYLLPITDGHKTKIGSISYVPPHRFVDGDRPRIAARVIADLDLTPETIDAASYQYLKSLMEQTWPELFWYAARVRKPVQNSQR